MKAEHGSKRGAARLAALALVLTALVLACGLWLLNSRKNEASAPTPRDGAGVAAATRVPGDDLAQPAGQAATPRESTGDARGSADARATEARFSGPSRGRIRGELVAEGVTFPESWTLAIDPHPYLVGKEHAISKRVEFRSGERAFDVGDLPLGGYRVRAESSRANSTEAAVLLVRTSNDVFVTLKLSGSGLIDGRVLDALDVPAVGLPIVLEAQATHVRRRTETDVNGAYVFRDVLDGEYTLTFGEPESPLIPSVPLSFQAPTMRIPDKTLPPTGALSILTCDTAGRALGDAEVTGYGIPKGTVRARTGADGRAIVRCLLPGQYRLEAKLADGRRGKADLVLGAGPPMEATIPLRD